MARTSKQPALAARALAVLNRALAADPEAVAGLLVQRVECNRLLARDPEIVVLEVEGEAPTYHVGVLGLINGIVGAPGVRAVVENGRVVRFELNT